MGYVDHELIAGCVLTWVGIRDCTFSRVWMGDGYTCGHVPSDSFYTCTYGHIVPLFHILQCLLPPRSNSNAQPLRHVAFCFWTSLGRFILVSTESLDMSRLLVLIHPLSMSGMSGLSSLNSSQVDLNCKYGEVLNTYEDILYFCFLLFLCHGHFLCFLFWVLGLQFDLCMRSSQCYFSGFLSFGSGDQWGYCGIVMEAGGT